MSPEWPLVCAAALSPAIAAFGAWLTAREPDEGWINYLTSQMKRDDRGRAS